MKSSNESRKHQDNMKLSRKIERIEGTTYTDKEIDGCVNTVAKQFSMEVRIVLDTMREYYEFNPDKIKGMIFGVALGDALGAPHEPRFSKKKYTGVLEHTIDRFSRFQKKWRRSVVGQYTDDTEMMIVLMKMLNERGTYSTTAAIKGYLDWANSPNNNFMGNNTRTLFKGVKTVEGYKRRYEKTFSTPESEWTQSNGALMRCAPLALLPDWAAIEDCTLTNPSPVCIDAEVAYLHALRGILMGKIPDEVYGDAVRTAKLGLVKEYIKKGYSAKVVNINDAKKGWVLYGLYCAMLSFNYETYADGIGDIIQRGGDTDTNAAIAGALLGARFGYSEIVKDPVTRKNIDILLSADTTKGDIPRPFHDIKKMSVELSRKFS
jgi:ADP-ribosyl-[dinitrogen reductase] hydrolase